MSRRAALLFSVLTAACAEPPGHGPQAPSRVRVDLNHEAATVLTRPDWIQIDADGREQHAVWLIELAEPCRLDVTLVFREQRVVEIATFATGLEKPYVEHMVVEDDRIDYEGVPFGAGSVDFRVSCESGDGPFAPYQVELRRR